MVRRRGLRCCVLLAFFVMTVVLTFMFGSEYVQPQLEDVSFPKIKVPEWAKGKSTPNIAEQFSDENFKPHFPAEFLNEEDIQEPTSKKVPAPKPSPSPPHISRPAELGPNGVWIETTIPGGAYTHGIIVLDNLYMRNGTFFVLTADKWKFPWRFDMITKPILTEADGVDLEPTKQVLQFLHPSTKILGKRATRITGLSVIVNDPPSTMNNFYNWWGEIVLGAWRVYSKLSMEDSEITTLPLPSRFILPVVSNGEWRDDAKMTGPLMRTAFPHASVEQSDYWQDLLSLDSTVVFDRVILVSREAAYRHPPSALWLKMTSGAMQIQVPSDFWQPIRDAVVRNMLGYLPILNEIGAVVGPPHAHPSTKPVITYISRQGSTRRLDENDHEGLIDALQALEREGICEFHVLEMERATLLEQIELAAKSTILVGVHGMGLVHQLWMPQSRRSTLLEIVWPKAYVFDHEIIARNLGHKHYAVWNDTLVTYPEGSYAKGVYSGEEFDSNAIPVYGPSVARIIKERLSL